MKFLTEETEIVLNFIKSEFDTKGTPHNYKASNEIPRIKNAADSEECRKEGNELYVLKHHDEQIHEKIWILYTKSIALAPNNSEELAQGYGNRAALLFHMRKFLECVINCDRALLITKSDNLKLKLLYRKAESLLYINETSVKDTCAEAKEFINKTSLNRSIKNEFRVKFDNILSSSYNMGLDKPIRNSKLYKHYCEELSNFTRQEKVPCASQSIKISYNKKWGRHVVATQDISPGEIIAIEENFCTLTNVEGKYLACSYCNQVTWVSFPCENCIDDLYCSKNCQQSAWNEYHYFECPLYPHYFKDVPENEAYFETLYLRLFLKIMHKAGSFEKIINDLIMIESCSDPCSKSLSEDLVLDVLDIKSFYSLSSRPLENLNAEILHSDLHMICRVIFLLARKTNFFGEVKHLKSKQMKNDPQIIFAIILFLRTLKLLPYNMNMFLHPSKEKLSVYGSYITTFLNIFNHSCDPNVESFVAKNNRTIIYSKYPIKKGSQLFVCYFDREKLSPFEGRNERQDYLKYFYDFVCCCTPCTKDWSSQPSIMSQKSSMYLLQRFKDFTTTLKIIESGKHMTYSPVTKDNIIMHLEWLADNFTVNCKEYETFSKCLKQLLQDLFGTYKVNFPRKCDRSVESY